jgi:hypothetical protein
VWYFDHFVALELGELLAHGLDVGEHPDHDRAVDEEGHGQAQGDEDDHRLVEDGQCLAGIL